MKALLTRKAGMTSIINDDGIVHAVTLLSASQNTITQIKTNEIDGYLAVQVGAETSKKMNKPLKGHSKASGMTPKVIKEVRVDTLPEELSVGSTLGVDIFNTGDKVSVTATSKGKGWAGAIKRHNFSRQRKTHGAKGATRRVGSIGSMYPQKIFKGKKMAGQHGGEQVTVKNLTVALVDTEQSVIGVVGAVPGPRNGIVIIREATR